jgi:PhzF family phenazine biosynthesis protein
MNIDVEIVNAFVDGDIGGNPAGVVLDADGLSSEQKLQVARQVGLSETAFVSTSSVATVKLEFFTPTRQIAHCGHATIATFCRLRELGRVAEGTLSKETVEGMRKIIIQGDKAYMEQRAPTYSAVEAHSVLERAMLESLGIDSGDLMAGLRPEVVNTGNAFLIVPLKDSAILSSLTINVSQIAEISHALDIVGYYAFSPRAMKAGRDVTTRMFAPSYGIDEESATGMAAGPLACYLRERLGLGERLFHIEQGCFMQPASPSVIQVHLDVEDGAIRSVMAGGRARSVSTIRVQV